MTGLSSSHSGVAVIGAGVVGLTTAIELARRGERVTVFFDPVSVAPASWAAPALFTPYPGPDEARFRRWSERSLSRLNQIAAEFGSESGVHIGELREYFYKQPASRPWLDELVHNRPIRPLPGGAQCVEATTSTRPHIDMLRYMPWLRSRAEGLGVRFVERRIKAIDELVAEGWKKIVDCAGVGARELAGDKLVKPMHGQVVHVPNDIGLTYSLHDDAQKPENHGRVAYIFVFRDRLVLGGTFDAGREDARSDTTAVEGIVDRCRELLRIDGHPRWDELARGEREVRVGVRPTRGGEGAFEWTRVEREQVGGAVVVHNYGHGRSGASFSWATAEEAAQLAG